MVTAVALRLNIGYLKPGKNAQLSVDIEPARLLFFGVCLQEHCESRVLVIKY